MKVVVFFLVFLFLFCFPSFAQSDLLINADNILYEENSIEAFGSVEATYKDVEMTGNHLIYHQDEKQTYLDNGFTLLYDNIHFNGELLDYSLTERKGYSEKVFLTYERAKLYGEKVDFDSEKVILEDSYFDSCGLPEPHYRFTAQKIILYTKIGWIVAYNGFFWFYGVPTVFLPVYVYDLTAAQRRRRNILPYPVIGSNDKDGWYISESLPWFASQTLNGEVNINYAEKKGWGGGVATRYSLARNSRGEIRLFGNQKDGPFGGITHVYSFGEKIGLKETIPLLLFAPADYQFDIELDLSYLERINYERVSKLPKATFNFRDIPLPFVNDVSLTGNVFTGYLTEESSGLSASVVGGGVTSSHKFFKTDSVSFTQNFTFDYIRYQREPISSWERFYGKTQMDYLPFPFLALGLGYKYYFDYSGNPLFNYENYRFSTKNQVNSSVIFIFGKSSYGVELVYDLPELDPYDIDYIAQIGFHCYSVGIKYRSIRREFSFMFSLD